MKDTLANLAKGKIFSKLNLQEAYNRVQIKRGTNGKPLSAALWDVSNFVYSLLGCHSTITKLSKCEFHKQKIDYLDYRISHKGVEMDPEKVWAILEWALENNFKASWD